VLRLKNIAEFSADIMTAIESATKKNYLGLPSQGPTKLAYDRKIHRTH
jgi:hypothetical protein